MNRRTFISVFLAVLAVLVVGGLAVVRLGTLSAKLTIEIAPINGSKLMVNGQGRRAGSIRVRPGQIRVSVTRTGFGGFNQTITVAKGDKKYVGIILQPNTPATANWYADHPADNSKAQSISSKSFDNDSQQTLAKAPLIKELPFLAAGSEFRIDYGVNPDDTSGNSPVIYITAPNATARADALTWIKYQGYNSSDYKIIYVNKSP